MLVVFIPTQQHQSTLLSMNFSAATLLLALASILAATANAGTVKASCAEYTVEADCNADYSCVWDLSRLYTVILLPLYLITFLPRFKHL